MTSKNLQNTYVRRMQTATKLLARSFVLAQQSIAETNKAKAAKLRDTACRTWWRSVELAQGRQNTVTIRR